MFSDRLRIMMQWKMRSTKQFITYQHRTDTNNTHLYHIKSALHSERGETSLTISPSVSFCVGEPTERHYKKRRRCGIHYSGFLSDPIHQIQLIFLELSLSLRLAILSGQPPVPQPASQPRSILRLHFCFCYDLTSTKWESIHIHSFGFFSQKRPKDLELTMSISHAYSYPNHTASQPHHPAAIVPPANGWHARASRGTGPNVLVGRYRFVENIGKGGFGVVGKYLDLISGEEVAIKTIPPSIVNHETKRLFREVDIMGFLYERHPCIITYDCMFATPDIGSAQVSPFTSQVHASSSYFNAAASAYDGLLQALDVTEGSYGQLPHPMQHCTHLRALLELTNSIQERSDFHVHIVMPYSRGDILEFTKVLSDSSRHAMKLSDEYIATASVVIGFKTALGIDFLHKCGVLHRDIKPENVLVDLDPTDVYKSNAIVADLGLARDSTNSDTAYVCTRYYRPPEIITQIFKADEKADVWSLGCVLFEICTGATLFLMSSSVNRDGLWDGGMASAQLEVVLNMVGTPSHDDIYQHVPDGNPKTYLLQCQPRPSRLKENFDKLWKLRGAMEGERRLWFDLIQKCLAFFPRQRPTAAEVCEHPLFRMHRLYYDKNVKAQRYTPSRNPGTTVLDVKRGLLDVLASVLSRCSEAVYDYDDEEEEEEEEAPQYAVTSSTPAKSAPQNRTRGLENLALPSIPFIMAVAERGEGEGESGRGSLETNPPEPQRRRLDDVGTSGAPAESSWAGMVPSPERSWSEDRKSSRRWWVQSQSQAPVSVPGFNPGRRTVGFAAQQQQVHQSADLSPLANGDGYGGAEDEVLLASYSTCNDNTNTGLDEEEEAEGGGADPVPPYLAGQHGLPPSVWRGMQRIDSDDTDEEPSGSAEVGAEGQPNVPPSDPRAGEREEEQRACAFSAEPFRSPMNSNGDYAEYLPFSTNASHQQPAPGGVGRGSSHPSDEEEDESRAVPPEETRRGDREERGDARSDSHSEDEDEDEEVIYVLQSRSDTEFDRSREEPDSDLAPFGASPFRTAANDNRTSMVDVWGSSPSSSSAAAPHRRDIQKEEPPQEPNGAVVVASVPYREEEPDSIACLHLAVPDGAYGSLSPLGVDPSQIHSAQTSCLASAAHHTNSSSSSSMLRRHSTMVPQQSSESILTPCESTDGFPVLEDSELQQAYENPHLRFPDAASALDRVLQDLTTYANDKSKSRELRKLLKYFASQDCPSFLFSLLLLLFVVVSLQLSWEHTLQRGYPTPSLRSSSRVEDRDDVTNIINNNNEKTHTQINQQEQIKRKKCGLVEIHIYHSSLLLFFPAVHHTQTRSAATKMAENSRLC
eukprot:gene11906-8188_t